MIEVFADVRCPFAHVGLRRVLDETTRRCRKAGMSRIAVVLAEQLGRIALMLDVPAE